MNKNIFLACDISSQKEILELLTKVHEDISGIKIGLQYITQHSPDEIRELAKFNKPIFYDGKFFDIKNTLIESIKSLQNLNVSYATVHLLNGLESLKSANKVANEINVIAPNLKCFTPGIRQDKNKDDQKRTMNAKQALDAGSDCLIIGRPITKGDPKKNIQEILSSIK